MAQAFFVIAAASIDLVLISSRSLHIGNLMELKVVRVLPRKTRAIKYFLWYVIFNVLRTLYGRRKSRIPSSLHVPERRPFMAFTGSGFLMCYYHGIATYVRDHFHVDSLRLSAVSGSCYTILALAMGLDLYQVMILGLYVKKWVLEQGVYMNSFDAMVNYTVSLFEKIGLTDADVAATAARGQCFIGVTQCFPPRHCCINVPSSVRELLELWLCSCSVVPFFSTPGVFRGRYYADGGFSAVWSVPPGQPWDDVIKVTCVPRWCSVCPPAMAEADIQPKRFMPTEILILYPWAHQRELIKRGYEDARRNHDMLVARGLKPLENAPITPWYKWEKLFASIDENNLPELSTKRSTQRMSPVEYSHEHILRTFSETNLKLFGDSSRRLQSCLSDFRRGSSCD